MAAQYSDLQHHVSDGIEEHLLSLARAALLWYKQQGKHQEAEEIRQLAEQFKESIAERQRKYQV